MLKGCFSFETRMFWSIPLFTFLYNRKASPNERCFRRREKRDMLQRTTLVLKPDRRMAPSIFFISAMNGGPWGGSEELWYRSAVHAAKTGRKVGCALYYWPGKEQLVADLVAAGVAITWLPNEGRTKKDL